MKDNRVIIISALDDSAMLLGRNDNQKANYQNLQALPRLRGLWQMVWNTASSI